MPENEVELTEMAKTILDMEVYLRNGQIIRGEFHHFEVESDIFGKIKSVSWVAVPPLQILRLDVGEIVAIVQRGGRRVDG